MPIERDLVPHVADLLVATIHFASVDPRIVHVGSNFALKDVKELVGIRGVTAAQVEAARERGRRIRMVATAERVPRVGVTELDETDPLVVNGASHSVKFRTSHGDKFVGGVGAGGPSTSAAVLRDIIHVAKAARGES